MENFHQENPVNSFETNMDTSEGQDKHAIIRDYPDDYEITETDPGSKEDETSSHNVDKKLKEVNEEVLLTAPTGKAASILGKRIGIPAHTALSHLHISPLEESGWKCQ